jgi:hypothetical protein
MNSRRIGRELLRRYRLVYWPPSVWHSLRWAALVIPFGALCATQLVARVVPPIERTAKVAEVLPQDPKAQLNYGKVLREVGAR